MTPTYRGKATETPESVIDLNALFSPRGIAVVGASEHRSRAGGRVLNHLLDNGYTGNVYPVNPNYDEIRGERCYARIEDVPDPVDLAVICVAASLVPETVTEAGRRGLSAVIIHSDGFRAEPGLEAELRGAWRSSGMRALGPNTNGLRVAPIGLFADASSGIAAGGHSSGRVAVITQSGGLGGYFGSTFLRKRGVGAKYLVDTGNELDVDAADCLSFFADDPEIDAIGLILESCKDGRRLAAETRRALDKGKKVLIFNLATNAVSAEAASSHTGAIAGRFDIFSQIMVRAGARICDSTRQFTDALALCARGSAPDGNGLGVVTPSGGFGVLASDLAEQAGIELPQPSTEASAELRAQLPLATFANPLDTSSLHRNREQGLAEAVVYLAGQQGISSLVVWQPHALLDPDRAGHVIEALTSAGDRVTIPIYLCGDVPAEVQRRLWDEARIVTFECPDDLIDALRVLVDRTEDSARDEHSKSMAHGPSALKFETLVGEQAGMVLAPSGAELVLSELVNSEAEVRALSSRCPRGVFLKGQSPHHAHKSELGLVIGPVTGDAAAEAYRTIAERLNSLGGGAVTAESAEEGIEVAIGMIRDASFGPVLMVGAGGRLVELLGDVGFALAPTNESDARRLLERLSIFPLLAGFRGSERSDVDALVRMMVDVSELAANDGLRLEEVDLNPVIVRAEGQGAVIVDALLQRRN